MFHLLISAVNRSTYHNRPSSISADVKSVQHEHEGKCQSVTFWWREESVWSWPVKMRVTSSFNQENKQRKNKCGSDSSSFSTVTIGLNSLCSSSNSSIRQGNLIPGFLWPLDWTTCNTSSQTLTDTTKLIRWIRMAWSWTSILSAFDFTTQK